jgi:CheY-like chemotaxis protein/HPt (histidine-containing phosphotransfer) domain-containing protein
LLGGRIWLESGIGSGSRFHFTADFGMPGQQTAEPELERLRGAPVLVVDDNATQARILADTLAGWRMEAATAENAPAALAALEQAAAGGKPFRAVLIDERMPGIGGLALAQAIHGDRRLAGVRAILLVSGGQSSETVRFRKAGIAATLSKPLKQSELLATLLHALGPGRRVHRAPRPSAPDARPLRILLAEDNPVNQKLAARVLEKRGHTVSAVANGAEAVRVFEESGAGAFDLILMDVQMPGMDGLEATTRIRKLEAGGTRVPILAMTAESLKGDRERCLAAGMDDYLSKPVSADELQVAVARLVPAPAGSAPAEQAMLDHLNGDAGLLRELARLFLADSGKLMRAVRRACGARDGQALAAAAHQLKGSAGNFRAGRACDAARQVETLARQGDWQAAQPACAELEAEIHALRRRLEPLSRSRPPRARRKA